MKVQLRPAAEVELQDVAQWYEGRVFGLGAEFTAAVQAAFLRIESSPRQFAKLAYSNDNDVRRALVNRFPYQVIYKNRCRSALGTCDRAHESTTLVLATS